MFPTPEENHTQLGYRGISNSLANRDKMLKEVEMPVFSGHLPFDWISRVERFFRIGNYNDEEKLHPVSLSLEGPVLNWFNGELLTDPFMSWIQFTERLLERFAGSLDDEPAARLFCLQQTGDIVDYVNKFEALRNQVTGIDEKNLVKVFYNGLKPEMKEVIRIKELKGLTNHKLAVLKMHNTTFCKVMSTDKTSSAKSSYSGGFQKRTVALPEKTATNTTRESGSNRQKTDKPFLCPRQYHTDAELDKMCKEGFCFQCKGKWYKGHPCNNMEQQILTSLIDW